ncbi:hypothetical protein ACFQJC_07520 [Haloferax namakaokahaiae]|uniref:DUF7999 domain-containing protein n=1 Tax=Haloferax namakaokahaiae TaxID=1748331 RepID=A0ABD5ZDS6_9EURY
MLAQSSVPVLVSVRRPMNDHESMTVEVNETNETRHLVAYETDRIRDTLAALPVDTRVPLEMVRLSSRSNVWKVVALHGRRPQRTNQTVSTAE